MTRTRAVPGEGPPRAAVMIIGEAPGANEDAEGRPFVGAAGKNLEALLARASLGREDVFITNVVKCRPDQNRRPTRNEAEACHPYLRRQMELIEPRVVVLLGDTALREVFPESSLGEMHGRTAKRSGRTYYPSYHPASMIYNPSLKAVLERDFVELGRLLRSLPAD